MLQYRGQSARWTKAQQYATLAKGGGPSRRRCFATQSDTYTNPNVSGMARTGYVEYAYPTASPGAPNNPAGPFAVVPNECGSLVVRDGGTLVCGTRVGPCDPSAWTTVVATNKVLCFPASCSDVPGQQTLCWDASRASSEEVPRVRRTMTSVGNKFPNNYKFLRPALHACAGSSATNQSFSSPSA